MTTDSFFFLMRKCPRLSAQSVSCVPSLNMACHPLHPQGKENPRSSAVSDSSAVHRPTPQGKEKICGHLSHLVSSVCHRPPPQGKEKIRVHPQYPTHPRSIVQYRKAKNNLWASVASRVICVPSSTPARQKENLWASVTSRVICVPSQPLVGSCNRWQP